MKQHLKHLRWIATIKTSTPGGVAFDDCPTFPFDDSDIHRGGPRQLDARIVQEGVEESG